MNYYTEQGVLARRDRDMAELADEIEAAVAPRYAELQADPPTDGPPRRRGPRAASAGATSTLLGNRPVDVWMHEQDIRRAVDRPGGYDSPAADARARALGPGAADGGRQARRTARRDADPARTSRTPGWPGPSQVGDDGERPRDDADDADDERRP